MTAPIDEYRWQHHMAAAMPVAQRLQRRLCSTPVSNDGHCGVGVNPDGTGSLTPAQTVGGQHRAVFFWVGAGGVDCLLCWETRPGSWRMFPFDWVERHAREHIARMDTEKPVIVGRPWYP